MHTTSETSSQPYVYVIVFSLEEITRIMLKRLYIENSVLGLKPLLSLFEEHSSLFSDNNSYGYVVHLM